MATPFEIYAAKGNEMLHQITEQLKVSRDKAFYILRAVLHTTRNHISLQDSLQIISQLPMPLKGLYVDQWESTQKELPLPGIDDFVEEVSRYDKELAHYSLATRERTLYAIEAVFKGLEAYLPYAAFQNILEMLPAVVRVFIQNSISQPITEHD